MKQLRLFLGLLLLFPCLLLAQDQADWDTLRAKANVFFKVGDYAKSLPLDLQSQQLAEAKWGKSSDKYMKITNRCAIDYFRLDRNDKAAILWKEALDIRKQWVESQGKVIEKDTTYLQYLSNYAIVCEYWESLTMFQKCVNFTKTLYGDKHPYYATSLHNLAGIYTKIGKEREAIVLEKEASSLRKAALTTDNSEYVESLNNLGVMYNSIGECENALPFLEEGLSIVKNKYLNMALLDNLAVCYAGLGKVEKTLDLQQKGLLLIKETWGTNNVYYAKALANLALTYTNMSKYTEALASYQEAISLRKEAMGKDYYDDPYIQINLAALYWDIGNRQNAFQLFSQINKQNFSAYQNESIGLSEQDRQQLWAITDYNFKVYISLCFELKDTFPEAICQAYNNQLNTAGILLQGTERLLQSLRQSQDTNIFRLYNQFIAQKKLVAKWSTWDSLQLKDARISLEIEAEKASNMEQELAQKSLTFRQASDTIGVQWQQVQQALKTGEAAVEIVRFPKRQKAGNKGFAYAALVLTPETKVHPLFVLLPFGKEMEGEWYENYLKNYIGSRSNDDPLSLRDTLSYARYLKPIMSAVGKAKTIYFVADGFYHKLNLNTLWTENKQYVIQQWQIHQIASTRELLHRQPEKALPAQATAVLFGNPTCEKYANPVASRNRADAFSSLDSAEAEVKIVGEMMKKSGFQVQIYLKEAATEEQVKALQHPTMVVFATHGAFIDEKVATYSSHFHPMYPTKSMLYFAVSPEKDTLHREDGILYAAEAASLNLEGTELVVLSACETGLGNVENGEGVFGLQRAFRIAGAKDLLVSCWDVDDGATKELMTTFFANYLEKKMSKFEAFYQAQLSLIRKYPNEPKLWGGFILKEKMGN